MNLNPNTMKTPLLFIALAFVLAFTSCKTTRQAATPKGPTNIIVGENSQTSLDWAGDYTGTLPCADCEGILTTITLNKDLTYKRATTYLGKTVTPFIETGKFTWEKGGSSIALTNTAASSPNRYLVHENKLVQLDMEGKVFTGKLADLYLLHKAAPATSNKALTDKKWKLVEMNGKPVKNNSTNGKDYFITLQAEGNKINGFAGCNNFFGTYELTQGNRISFSKMASTMMACPDMTTEQELFMILETVDNYTLGTTTLQLSKARMAPMATFELLPEQ
jgi:heat shock protein HslJ